MVRGGSYQTRRIWIECREILLHAWTYSNMKKNGRVWNEVKYANKPNEV